MSAPAGTADTRVELELTPEDNARLAVLRGPLDQNLRLIEQRLGVEQVVRHTGLTQPAGRFLQSLSNRQSARHGQATATCRSVSCFNFSAW